MGSICTVIGYLRELDNRFYGFPILDENDQFFEELCLLKAVQL